MEGNETKKLICRTLISMMKDKPFYAIKVTDIVKQTGISRSSFYAYFDSVYDVLQTIEDDYLDALPECEIVQERFESRKGQNYAAWLGSDEMACFHFIHKNNSLYRILTGSNGESSFYIRLRNRHCKIYDKLLESELPDLSREERNIITIFMAGGKMAVQDWWAHHEKQIDIETYTGIVTNLWSEIFQHIIDQKKKL